MESKPIFKSKTMAVSALVIVASFFPEASEWVKAHPDATLQALGILGAGLRWISKGKVSLFGEG